MNLFILQLFNIIQIYSQSKICPLLYVDKINISGNEKTKSWVILKECDIHIGDTLSIEQIGKKVEDIEFKLRRFSIEHLIELLIEELCTF